MQQNIRRIMGIYSFWGVESLSKLYFGFFIYIDEIMQVCYSYTADWQGSYDLGRYLLR